MAGGRWIGAAVLAGVAVAAMYATGVLGGEHAQQHEAVELAEVAAPSATGRAERRSVDVAEIAIGTVHSRRTVTLAAQVTGRIVELHGDVGTAVKAGQQLALLDDREPQSRLAQSRQAASAGQAAVARNEQVRTQARAGLERARAHFERTQKLAEQAAATNAELEQAQADFAQADARVAEAEAAIAAAQAQLEQARASVQEAEIAVEHTRVACPIDGVIVERPVERGDLAWPGRALLVVLDPRALRLEARVREGSIAKIAPGAELEVELPAAAAVLRGRVAEIVPVADPRSRTFEVRVEFDAVPGVLPGMFGRLRLPGVRREVVSVPSAAIARVGQIETVIVRDGERWTRRMVTTGALLADGSVEVLTGLAGGETVGLASGGA